MKTDKCTEFNYNFHDILRISSNIDLGMPYFQVGRVDPDLIVKVVDDYKPEDWDDAIRLGATFFGKHNKNYVYYETSLFKQKLQLYLGDIHRKTRVFCNKPYYRYVRLPLVFSTPITILAWRVGWVKLLYKGFTFLHGACLALEKDAFLLLGFSNTGKSRTTLLSLLQDKNLQYLSDDAVILDAKGLAYCNFTRISSRLLKSIGLPITLRSRVAIALENAIPPPISYFIGTMRGSTLNIEDFLGNSRIKEKAKVRTIIFLERGTDDVKELNKDEAIEKMLIQTKEGLAPHYSSVPLLLYYSYFNQDFKLDELMRVEREIITKTVEDSDIFTVRSRSGNFVDSVLKIIYGDLR